MSECNACKYKTNGTHGEHCYMFINRPRGLCMLHTPHPNRREGEFKAFADAYYQGFGNLPGRLKKRISLEMLRGIFDHMVVPALEKYKGN